MKALLVLYSGLKDKEINSTIENNIKLLYRTVGIDSIYASISEHFLDMFHKFPDLCFVNNSRDEPSFGTYRGLRKLRGNDVLVIEGFVRLNRELIQGFLNRVNLTVGTIRGRWSGLAFINMKNLDYVVRSLEFSFGKDLKHAFEVLQNKYSIAPEFLELPD